MPLSRDFKETVARRMQEDSDFRRVYLEEAVDCMLGDDVATGRAMLRDFINATIGFEPLGQTLERSPKSLMRMLSAQGNPRSDDLFAVIAELQRYAGVTLSVRALDRKPVKSVKKNAKTRSARKIS